MGDTLEVKFVGVLDAGLSGASDTFLDDLLAELGTVVTRRATTVPPGRH